MSKKVKWTFFALVMIQGLHSIEEFIGKLWENFQPARILCSLVSDNLVTGFLIINIGLFIFGLWCWIFPIRKGYFYSQFLIWFWIVLELINGIGHPIWTFMQGTYTPGILTSSFLLVLAIVLIQLQFKEKTKAQQRL